MTKALKSLLISALLFTSNIFASEHIAEKFELSTSQQQWLKDHPNIRLGVDQNFYPIEFVDNGKWQGISAEVSELISQQTGIQFNYDGNLSWPETITLAKKNEIDIVSAVGKTKSREDFWLFSKPYLTKSTVFITRKDHKPVVTNTTVNGKSVYSLNSLLTEQVAVTEDYPPHHRLQSEWPKIPLVLKPSQLEVLKSVQSGEASVGIVILDTASPLMNAYQMNDLKIHGNAFSNNEYVYFAVRKDWPELLEIINKAIDVIGHEKINRIQKKWLVAPVSLGIDKNTVIVYLSILLAIAITLLFWNFVLKNKLNKYNKKLKKDKANSLYVYQKMQEQNKDLSLLSKMDFDKSFVEIIQKLSKHSSVVLNVGRASIWRYSDDKNELTCLDLYEQNTGTHTQEGSLSVELYPNYFKAIETDRILNINNAREDTRTREFLKDYLKPLDVHSMLVLPILVNNKTYGVVCFEQINKPRVWREDEISYGASIANLVALAIESSQRKSAMDQLVSQSRHVVMGEMIATLTHQWKQPLTAMMLSVGTLKNKFKSMNIDEKDMTYVNTHTDKIERIMLGQSQMLTEFRDFFHPDKRKELFNIGVSINSVLEILEGGIKSQNIQVITEIPNELEIMGYERDFRHVIINLIQNSVDQITRKEIKKPIIDISARINKKYISITISDNAGGIKPSILSTVFEPYVSDKSLNGTGLGLYISKRIIQEQFDGDIFATNTKDGAQFLIKCPPQKHKDKK